jgi:hypothetical protein
MKIFAHMIVLVLFGAVAAHADELREKLGRKTLFWRLWLPIYGIALCLMAFGCSTLPPAGSEIQEANSPVTTPAPEGNPPVAFKADWDGKPDGAKWTAMLISALETHGQALLQGYYPEVCGDRKAFYVMLLSSLARYESSFNPAASYTEAFADSKGNKVVSRGLFQMSIESSNGNYACGFKDAQEIHQPEKAIPCAVKAANKLIARDKVLYGSTVVDGKTKWHGLAAYWSPFRDATKRSSMLAKAKGTCR